jgi:AcrR family transcriptional regulator
MAASTDEGRAGRARSDRRERILETAARVFEEDGLEGASLRAIAARAGYTPAALYFHFDSKEALYAALLERSLARLLAHVEGALAEASGPEARLAAAARAFFDFYAENPRDLDLGFYLFRGGMKPESLGRQRDRTLNAALNATLQPIAVAAEELGIGPAEARAITADIFAHATGLLLLHHTGRIRMFSAAAPDLMDAFIATKLAGLKKS